VYETVGSGYHFSLRYHGYAGLADFAQRFQEVLEESDDEAVVTEVLEQLLRYGNTTYAWSHQAFPWYLGMHFPAPGTQLPGGRWEPS
jgi:hypothetical protein